MAEFCFQAWFDPEILRKMRSFPISPGTENTWREVRGRCPCQGKGGPGQQHEESPPWGATGKAKPRGSRTPGGSERDVPAWQWENTQGQGQGGTGPFPALLPSQAAARRWEQKGDDKTDPREGCADPTRLQQECLSLQSSSLSSTIADYIYKHNRLSFKGKSFSPLCHEPSGKKTSWSFSP